jgi:DNA-binding transcriptional LysR family regulator
MGTIVPNLNELQFFVHVSRAQSFTLAAKRLGVPKSTVSRAIHRLETRLGIRLVERTTRRVSLTEAGELYLDRCQRVMEEAEQAELAIGALQAQPRGKLRIGAPVQFVRSVLGPILGEFLNTYPELRLELHLLNRALSLREGSLDLIISAGPLEDSGLLVKPLLTIRLGVYASPIYLQRYGTPDSPASLRAQRCITTNCGAFGEPRDSTIWRLRRGTEVQEVRVDSHASVPDPMINYQLAVAGVGVALLSQSIARKDEEQGRLIRILPDWEPDPVELHALYSSRLDTSPKVRVFLQFLRDHFNREALSDTQLHPSADEGPLRPGI